MADGLILATIIFLITYALIAIRGVPGTKFGRSHAALLGGILMLLAGVVAFTDLPKYINGNLLLLLLGMMLLVGSLEAAGFFDKLADVMLKSNPSREYFLMRIMLISAFLTALMLNDAVVLLLTPITIKCCRRLDAKPWPYLIALFVSSNIGSTATVIGNPQNAFVATEAGIGFMSYSMAVVPLTIVTLAVAMAMMHFFCRKHLAADASKKNDSSNEVADPFRMKILIALLAATMAMFALSDTLSITLSTIAIASGMIAWIIVLTGGRKGAVRVAKNVNWSVLIFFIGLFIVMGGMVSSGLVDKIMSVFPGFMEGQTPTVPVLVTVSAVLSNLMSNVPSVMLLAEMIPHETVYWLVLAVGSTLAGNATLIGAAANIIVAEEAEKIGEKVDFKKVLMIGLPITVVTLVITIFYFSAVF